jgi:3-oxoacyl-[acyl-carrier-protein] synthase II
MGLVSPCGDTVAENWTNILAGKSGIARITAFDVSAFDSKIGGEVKNFDPERFIDRKEARRMDRSVQLAMAAAAEAMAGMEGTFDAERFGAIVGSGIGGIQTFEQQHTVLMEKGATRISPFFIPMMISDMAAGQLSIRYGSGDRISRPFRRAHPEATRSATPSCTSGTDSRTRFSRAAPRRRYPRCRSGDSAR